MKIPHYEFRKKEQWETESDYREAKKVFDNDWAVWDQHVEDTCRRVMEAHESGMLIYEHFCVECGWHPAVLREELRKRGLPTAAIMKDDGRGHSIKCVEFPPLPAKTLETMPPGEIAELERRYNAKVVPYSAEERAEIARRAERQSCGPNGKRYPRGMRFGTRYHGSYRSQRGAANPGAGAIYKGRPVAPDPQYNERAARCPTSNHS